MTEHNANRLPARVPPSFDPRAVLAVLDDINGDGDAALDPERLIAHGLPSDVVRSLVRSEDLRSLELLRALLAQYQLSIESPYMGRLRSRTARLYSARLREHLQPGSLTEADRRELEEAADLVDALATIGAAGRRWYANGDVDKLRAAEKRFEARARRHFDKAEMYKRNAEHLQAVTEADRREP